MFEVGFSELLLVGVIALLVLGPERLPLAARTVGRGLGQAKRTLAGLRAQMQREIDLKELDAAPLQRLEQELRQGVSLQPQAANKEPNA